MLPLQESFEKNDLAQNIWSKQEIEYPIRRRNAHVQTTGLKTKTQTPLSQSWCTQQHTNARNAKRSLCVNMTRTRRHNMTYSRCARPTYVIIPSPTPSLFLINIHPLLSPPSTAGEIVVFSHVKCAWPFMSTVNLRDVYVRIPPTANKSLRFLL